MRCILISLMLVVMSSSVFAESFFGLVNVNRTTGDREKDGVKISESDSLSSNAYLSLNRPITPKLRYELFLRASLTDSDSTNIDGTTRSSELRSVEPEIQLSLSNPVYSVATGYRYEKSWLTSNTTDHTGVDEFYYLRLYLTPRELPPLFIEMSREPTGDISIDKLSASSGYQWRFKKFNLNYNAYYIGEVEDTPGAVVERTETDTITGVYSISYADTFRQGDVKLRSTYSGDYTSTKTEQLVTSTGLVVVERSSLGGLYDQGTLIQQNVNDTLPSEANLIDGNLSTGITAINLSTTLYHNIGIWLDSADDPVDRIYVYVNKELDLEFNLDSPLSWEVYKSDTNAFDGWTEKVTIASVEKKEDVINDLYFYEILFDGSQNAAYFKVINLDTASAGVPDLLVTEIQALYEESVVQGTQRSKAERFEQQFDVAVTSILTKKIDVSLSYLVKRTDRNPVSLLDSMGGIFESVYTDPEEDTEDETQSEVERNYALSLNWNPHRKFASSFRVSRSESVDIAEERDAFAHLYYLSLRSIFLPTLSASLSLTRSDNYQSNEKQSTSNSILLSVNSALYKGVSMITDLGYRVSENLTEGSDSSSTFLSGTLDATLTPRLSGHLTYNFSWLSSANNSSDAMSTTTFMTYRPGRFISLTGRFAYADSETSSSVSEGITASWRPVPAIRLSSSYDHKVTDPGSVTTDAFSNTSIWNITSFLEGRFAYTYAKETTEVETVDNRFSFRLNCRF